MMNNELYQKIINTYPLGSTVLVDDILALIGEDNESNNNKVTFSTADTIAEFFLSKSNISLKKLQLLLYYSYAWTLVAFNENEDNINNKLFNEQFEAWVHGPTIRSIYYRYEFFRTAVNDIPKIDNFDDSKINNEDIIDILNQVWEKYGIYTGVQLESLAHSESPWFITRGTLKPWEVCTDTIPDKLIYRYYKSLCEEDNSRVDKLEGRNTYEYQM